MSRAWALLPSASSISDIIASAPVSPDPRNGARALLAVSVSPSLRLILDATRHRGRSSHSSDSLSTMSLLSLSGRSISMYLFW